MNWLLRFSRNGSDEFFMTVYAISRDLAYSLGKDAESKMGSSYKFIEVVA